MAVPTKCLRIVTNLSVLYCHFYHLLEFKFGPAQPPFLKLNQLSNLVDILLICSPQLYGEAPLMLYSGLGALLFLCVPSTQAGSFVGSTLNCLSFTYMNSQVKLTFMTPIGTFTGQGFPPVSMVDWYSSLGGKQGPGAHSLAKSSNMSNG